MTLVFPTVLVLEDAARKLLVTPDQLRAEIEAGRLRGRCIAGQWRITEAALLEFLGEKPTHHLTQDCGPQHAFGQMPGDGVHHTISPVNNDHHSMDISWNDLGPHEHRWPKRADNPGDGIERYDRSFQSIYPSEGHKSTVLVAFTHREAYGDWRRKAVVFVEGYPTLEFVGVDDYDTNHQLVSPIKLPDRKELKPDLPIPSEYADMPVVVFNTLVTGPYSRKCQAVVVTEDLSGVFDDLNVMARHALIRAKWCH
jgi:hypothetical protein